MSGRVDWGGTDRVVLANMTRYGERVIEAINAVADYFSAVVETEAKTGAPWTDRTSNARQTLSGFKVELAKDVVAIYLAHGMDYGIFLETMGQGKWAIILPTLEANYTPIMQMLRDIFS